MNVNCRSIFDKVSESIEDIKRDLDKIRKSRNVYISDDTRYDDIESNNKYILDNVSKGRFGLKINPDK